MAGPPETNAASRLLAVAVPFSPALSITAVSPVGSPSAAATAVIAVMTASVGAVTRLAAAPAAAATDESAGAAAQLFCGRPLPLAMLRRKNAPMWATMLPSGVAG